MFYYISLFQLYPHNLITQTLSFLKIDKLISYVLVSPDMHKIHHHYRLPFTDANYGNIFSIWDRIFSTYMDLYREKIVYAVDVFPDEKENSKIGELLKQPFQSYQRPTKIKTN